MPIAPEGKAHHYNAYLRLYVALSPQHGEAGWQRAQWFEALPEEQKQPGHWYRYEGFEGLTEVRADGSGEWHKDGKLPQGVDPKTVVTISKLESVPTLLEEMVALLEGVPKAAPNHAEIEEIIEFLTDLPTPARAARLVKSFQKTLATVPAVAEEQIRFLRQASQQMVGTELLAGKVCGYDVAGLLIVAALAEAVAATDPEACSVILEKAAGLEVSALAELASRVMQDCWWRGMREKVTAGLNALRSQGESIIKSAQEGLYPEGHPELALDIYYGGLLQSIPYLLAAEEGYNKLKYAPNVTEDDVAAFARKAETAEEKLVRMTTAMVYAVQDVDLLRLRSKQAQVLALQKNDLSKAESLVFETINLKFFYPLNFRSVLLSEEATARPQSAPDNHT